MTINNKVSLSLTGSGLVFYFPVLFPRFFVTSFFSSSEFALPSFFRFFKEFCAARTRLLFSPVQTLTQRPVNAAGNDGYDLHTAPECPAEGDKHKPHRQDDRKRLLSRDSNLRPKFACLAEEEKTGSVCVTTHYFRLLQMSHTAAHTHSLLCVCVCV